LCTSFRDRKLSSVFVRFRAPSGEQSEDKSL
jgi:hypothetical protein